MLIAARDPQQAAKAANDIDGVEALPVGLDIASPESVQAAANAVTAHPGRLDVLINNAAGIPDRTETASGADLATAADALQVNLFGAWRMTQAFLPLLRR